MVILSLIFVFLNPDFWLPDDRFAEKYGSNGPDQVRKWEARAAKSAFELSNATPGTPQYDMLKEYHDHCLRFLSTSQQTVARVCAERRLSMWRGALSKVGRHIGP